MFGISGAVEDPTQALLLMVEHEGEVCALLADALLGQQQLVIKSLPAGVGKESGASGAAILGDGRISLILDVASILLLARGGRRMERSLSW
jgi:two-component system chemotaxis sensor kinase CheA